MRISRLIIILALAVVLYGQSVIVKVPDAGVRFEAGDSASIAHQLDSLATGGNELGKEFLLKSIIADNGISAIYSLNRHAVRVDSLLFSNDSLISENTQRHLFQRLEGTRPWKVTGRELDKIRNSYSFLSSKTAYSLARYGDNKLAAVIDAAPDFASNFSGIFGMSRNDDSKWEVTGQVDMHLENAWRTAGTVDLNWRRRNELSQNVGLKVSEPFLLGMPFGAIFKYSQDLEEGLYVRRETGAGVVTTFGIPGTWQTGIESATVSATAKGDSAGILNQKNQFLFAEWGGDTRDDRWLPQSGWRWKIYSAVGENNVNDYTSRITRAEILWDSYHRINTRLLIHAKLTYLGTAVDKGKVHVADKIRYGGVGDLRGYREDFFLSDWVTIPEVELIYSSSSRLRLSIFGNTAVQDSYRPYPYGYGVGLIQRTESALIEVSYGLSRDDRFSQGKIHFKVTGIL